MAHNITVYSHETLYGQNIRCGTGRYTDAAMFTTIVNLIRIANAVINYYYCAADDTEDDGYYTTKDGCLYQVKNGRNN